MKTMSPPALIAKISKIRKQALTSALAASLMAFAFLLNPTILHATEWWVNGSVSGTNGAGTQGDPCKTIGAAIAKSGTGDTITVLSGTYAESVTLKAGYVGTPYTLHSATNARVVITGFRPLPTAGNWTVYSTATTGTVYTITIQSCARDIFVGLEKKPLARMPAFDQTQAIVQSSTNNTVTLTAPLGVTISGTEAGNCFVYALSSNANALVTYPVTSVSGSQIILTGTIKWTGGQGAGGLEISGSDCLIVANHPKLCKYNGDWAYIALSASSTKLFYQASGTAELNTLQSRCYIQPPNNVQPITISKSNVLVDGIEVTGCADVGINITNATNATVKNCVIHQNGMLDATPGMSGVMVSGGTNVQLLNNMICCNTKGASLVNQGVSGTFNGITMTKCEIAYNEADGVDIGGLGTTKNPDYSLATNARVSQCYFHNQTMLEHPDDLQFFDSVSYVTVDSCYLTQAGQNVMGQDAHYITLSNNVFMGTEGRNTIPGHGSCLNWNFINNTFALSNGDSAIGMDNSCVITATNNLYYMAQLKFITSSPPAVFSTDYSLFWSGSAGGVIASEDKPWTNFTTTDAIISALGQEHNSHCADPKLGNMPLVVASPVPGSTLSELFVDQNAAPSVAGFNKWDWVEVDGDGIPRQIMAVNGTSCSITISPALNEYLSNGSVLYNWGPTPSLTVGVSGTVFSPVDTAITDPTYKYSGVGGALIGSSINTTKFPLGDFDNDGNRDVPALPSEIAATWHTYGKYPYFGVYKYIAPPVISSTLAVTGSSGYGFSYTITASGSATSFSADTSNLPSGLTFNALTGVISGTSSSPATYYINIDAANSGGNGVQQTLVLTILPPPPVITSGTVATGTNGIAFGGYTITATNSPASYGATGLPLGLNVNAATGIISGTPSVTGTVSSTISATNGGGTGSAALVFTLQPPAPVITSTLTATGTTGAACSYQITANNSPTSYGATNLPTGLSVNTATGLISGTAAASGTFNSTLSATNGGGTGTATLVMTIASGHVCYEPFDSGTTNNIGTSPGSASDIGLTGTTWSGANSVISPGLSYSGMPSLGNAIQFKSNIPSDRSIDMSVMPAGYTQVDTDSVTRLGKPGTTLWFRFLIRADAADPDGTLTASLTLNGNSTGGTAKLVIGDTGTNGNWSVMKGSTVGASSTPIVTGNTVLLVVRVKFVTGSNNDEVDLFVNPPMGATPPVTPDGTLRNVDIGTFDRMRISGNRQSTIDEVSIATDWTSL